MILSKLFYDKCGPSYQKAIDELEKNIAEIEKFDGATKGEKIVLTIYQFSKRYLTPGEYWGYCIRYVKLYFPMYSVNDTYDKLRRDIIKHAYYHMYLNMNWMEKFHWGSNCLKLDDFIHYQRSFCERVLCFPHKYLKFYLRKFQQHATKEPSKKVVKRGEEMLSLYPKIEAAIGDIHEWFQLLLKVDDDKYVKDNVEYRIGQDLHDIKLWKIYMNYLKQSGQFKYLLGIYSKYCRFFLEDDEIKKEYQKAMFEHGPVNLPWKNLFEFEKGCGMEEIVAEEEKYDIQSSFEEDLSPFDKSICRRFYDTYKAYQEFSLPGPLVLYVLNNAGHHVLRKLFASCKYFFAKQSTPICYRLRTGSREIYEDESLTLKEHSTKESFAKNFYITGIMYGGPLLDFLPKFYRCEAKFIRLLGKVRLTFNELLFLIGHGGVIQLNIQSSTIKDEKNESVALEDIMTYLRNVEELCLPNVKITEKTSHALISMKFNSKFDNIDIKSISGAPFDAEEFLEFLSVYKVDERYGFFFGTFTFCKKFDNAFVQRFKRLARDYTMHNAHCIVRVHVDDSLEENHEDDDD